MGAQVVNEKWIATEHKYERNIISYGQAYLTESWCNTFTGANQLPLCSVVYPGEFIRGLIDDYHFSYDLSEDFILHLMVFGHPRRPEVETTRGTCIHQSHRENSDNVSNVADRTNWTLDTGNGVFELLFENGWQFDRLSEGREKGAQRVQGLDEAMNAARRLVDALLPTLQQGRPNGPSSNVRRRREWRFVRSKRSPKIREAGTEKTDE